MTCKIVVFSLPELKVQVRIQTGQTIAIYCETGYQRKSTNAKRREGTQGRLPGESDRAKHTLN